MRNLLFFSILILWIISLAGCSTPESLPSVEPTNTLAVFSTRIKPASSTPLLEGGNFTPSGPTATPFVHIVQQGETLLGIAIQYGVTLDNLLLVNPGIDPRILSVGQSLRIPGPEGEPVDLLLPTPTPMQLTIHPIYCYPSTGNQVRCLTKLTNNLSLPAEGIGLQISFYDANGKLLDHGASYSLIRMLPAGISTVLDATFQVDIDRVAHIQTELISAVQVSNLMNKYIEVDLTNLKVDRSSDDRLIRFKGEVEIIEDLSVDRVSLTIQVFGFNLRGEPIGLNVHKSDLERADFPYAFELSLFSLSGAIEDFNFLIEAQPLNSIDS